MKLFIQLLFLCFAITSYSFAAGENCASPILVTAGCPAVSLANQSSTGMGNDVSSWHTNYYNYMLIGEDMVYAITYPTGSTSLIVSMSNLTNYAYLIATTDCAVSSTTVYSPISVYPGNNNNLTLALPSTGNILYLYVDQAGSNLKFDISFGIVTQLPNVSIADTRGKLEFATSSCIVNPFLRQVDIKKDGVGLQAPATFGPNNTSHEYCYTVFLQNLTGKEGVKSFQLTFNNGFTNVSLPTTSLPGSYATGTWNGTVRGNVVTWMFTNNNDATKGDYDDVTKTCLSYSFCINATPVATAIQVMNLWVTGDGKTPGYYGPQYSGCCATANCNLYGATGYSGTAAAAGFGIGIGTNGLPVDLLNVWLEKESILHWQTTQEKNVANYAIQYSGDGKFFETLETTAATGNNQQGVNTYHTAIDPYHLADGYLRIKSVDEDGAEKFSSLISYHALPAVDLLVSPNPVINKFHVQATDDIQSITLYDLNGIQVYQQEINNVQLKETDIDVSPLSKGVYTLQVITAIGIIHQRLVKE